MPKKIDELKTKFAELEKILSELSDDELQMVLGGGKPTHVNVSVQMAEADGTSY